VLTPPDKLVQKVATGKLHVQVGRTFNLDQIVEAHRKAGERSSSWRSPRTTSSGPLESTRPQRSSSFEKRLEMRDFGYSTL
jgi:hypothetical protein